MSFTGMPSGVWRRGQWPRIVLGRDAPELGPANPRLAHITDHVILLRPDRYVAACIPVDDVARGGEKVAALIAGTF